MPGQRLRTDVAHVKIDKRRVTRFVTRNRVISRPPEWFTMLGRRSELLVVAQVYGYQPPCKRLVVGLSHVYCRSRLKLETTSLELVYGQPV